LHHGSSPHPCSDNVSPPASMLCEAPFFFVSASNDSLYCHAMGVSLLRDTRLNKSTGPDSSSSQHQLLASDGLGRYLHLGSRSHNRLAMFHACSAHDAYSTRSGAVSSSPLRGGFLRVRFLRVSCFASLHAVSVTC
jgi:hypothetical protein